MQPTTYQPVANWGLDLPTLYPDINDDPPLVPPIVTHEGYPGWGAAGIPAVYIHDGFSEQPAPYLVQGGILPDPGTGSLYNSSVPMQDVPYDWHSWQEAPHTAPIVTHGSLLGDVVIWAADVD